MTENVLDKKFQKEINGGITGLVLLSVMQQEDQPMYGYQIAKRLSAGKEDKPLFKQGALYPVLRSMEKNGLLQSEIAPSDSGPPRKYYSITSSGEQTLVSWTEIWHEAKTFVDHILKGLKNE